MLSNTRPTSHCSLETVGFFVLATRHCVSAGVDKCAHLPSNDACKPGVSAFNASVAANTALKPWGVIKCGSQNGRCDANEVTMRTSCVWRTSYVVTPVVTVTVLGCVTKTAADQNPRDKSCGLNMQPEHPTEPASLCLSLCLPLWCL